MTEKEARPTSNKTPEQRKWLNGLKAKGKSYKDSGLSMFHMSLPEAKSLFEAFDLPISEEMSKILVLSDGHVTFDSKDISKIKTLEDARGVVVASWAFLGAAINSNSSKK